MQDFSVEEGPPNVWGVRFFEGGKKFYYWGSPNIWDNFSKICIKINRNLEIIGIIQEKCKLSEIF